MPDKTLFEERGDVRKEHRDMTDPLYMSLQPHKQRHQPLSDIIGFCSKIYSFVPIDWLIKISNKETKNQTKSKQTKLHNK